VKINACLAAGREESYGPDPSTPVTACPPFDGRERDHAAAGRGGCCGRTGHVPLEAVRKLLVQADDLGEAAVEESDPATGKQFLALSALIDRHFDDLQTLATQQERQLAANADALWEKSAADIEAAKAAPKASATDDRLDPFHDHIDQAASRLATSTRSTAIRSRTRSRHCDGGSRHSCWPAWPRSSSARLSRYSWPDGWAARSPDRCCR
jgi:hypothetical protein